MGLQEGPEVDRWDPEIDVLPRLDLKWLSTPHAELECAIIVLHVGLRIARMEEPILVDDHAGLDKGQERK